MALSKKQWAGHIMALCTVMVWSTTFVSTKVLLRSFQPIEVLVLRFIIGTLALFIMKPSPLRLKDKKHELYFAAAGLSGITLYFLFENIALSYTTASNVGIIISVAPIFTILLSRWLLPGIKLHLRFFLGFAAAITGIFFISFGGDSLTVNPFGDALTVLAALGWGFYSIAIEKVAKLGYPAIQATRRIFLYGLVFLLPALFIFPFRPQISLLLLPVNFLNLLYLGLGASAICFVVWNHAVSIIGPVKTSVYIYTSPIFTVLFSALILGERLTPLAMFGILLTLAGLVLSEGKLLGKKARSTPADFPLSQETAPECKDTGKLYE